MFAQLGNIQFSTAKTFGEFSEREAMNFAEHKLLDNKPRLQPTGASLVEISISIFFHHSFCTPKEEIAALKTAMSESEILPLVWGNGDVEGDFVIADIDVTKEETNPEGATLGATVQLSLKEFVVKDRLQQEQATNRNNAKAVGDKKPVAKKKVNPPTGPQFVAGVASQMQSNAAAVDKVFSADGGPNTPLQKNVVRKSLSTITGLCDTIKSKIKEGAEYITHLPDIEATVNSLRSTTNDLSAAVLSVNQDAAALNNRKTEFQASVKAMQSALLPLINQVITRR